jgi:hypothetical protein
MKLKITPGTIPDNTLQWWRHRDANDHMKYYTVQTEVIYRQ